MNHTLFFLFVILCFSSCNPAAPQNNVVDILHQYFASHLPAHEPGAAIAIVKNDSIIFKQGYGVADLKTQQPITPKTLFNLGSISKTFVANAILLLAQQGKLSVDDDLLRYFPDFKNRAIGQKVKIKHLLTHTSGLPDNRQVNSDTAFYLTARDAENWAPVMQADSLQFEPGSHFEYSNPAFNGLALIIEQVAGVPWQQFVIDNIMKPAYMGTSTITDGAHPTKEVAHAYAKGRQGWIEDDYGEEPTFPAAGNGGVWSSAEELVNYERALQRALFLTPQTIADSRTIKHFSNWRDTVPPTSIDWSWFKPATPGAPFIGWSWFITESAGVKTIGHTGSQGGFLCNYVSLPEKNILIVILCNTPRNVPVFTDHILSVLKKENWLDR